MAHWVELLDTLKLGPTTVAASATYDGNVVIAGDLTIAAGQMLTVEGKLQVFGSISCAGDLLCMSLECSGVLENNGPADVTIVGNCQVGLYVLNSGGGTIYIYGKLDINGDPLATEGYLDNTGGATVFVGGDCHISGDLTNTTGLIIFIGDLFANNITQTDITEIGGIQIRGRTEAASVTVNGTDGVGFKDLLVGSIQLDLSNISIDGECRVLSSITNTGAGNITITGNCQVGTHILNSGGGNITINGKLDINGDPDAGEGYLDNTGGATVFVGNDAHISSYLFSGVSYTGTQTAANDPVIMTDVSTSFVPNALIGQTIYNDTDGSSGVVTANDSTTVTVAALAGGLNNIWTTGDAYHVGISASVGFNGDLFIGGDCVSCGIVTVLGNCTVIGNIAASGGAGGSFIVKKDLQVSGDITNDTTGFNVYGNCYVGSNLFTGGQITNNDTMYVGGNCYAVRSIANHGIDLVVKGHCHCADISNDGTDVIVGSLDCQSMTNSGHAIRVTQGDCLVAVIFNTGTGSVQTLDLVVSGSVANSGGGDIIVKGKMDINGDPGDGDGYLDNTGGNDIFVGNDCHVAGVITNTTGSLGVFGELYAGDFTNNDTGSINILGNVFISNGSLNNSGTGIVLIRGYAQINGELDNTSTGEVQIHGNCTVRSGLFNSAAGGTVTITGILRCGGTITNGGTLAFQSAPLAARGISDIFFVDDVTNPGVVTLINLNEDFYLYEVRKFRLKAEDPGANTITIHLWESVNSLLTEVDSFDITNANFSTYFSLMDMFNVPHLSGSEIKITADVSADGPYEVKTTAVVLSTRAAVTLPLI